MASRDESEVSVRPATPADEGFIRQLSREVFSRFGDYATILINYFRESAVRTAVAEGGGSPVGFTMLVVEHRHPVIVDLVAIAVEPTWQGRGVGRILIDHVHECARSEAAEGVRSIVHLTVAEDNHRARAFFLAAGYAPAPGTAGRYPAGQRSVSMVRTLPEGR